MSRLDELFDKYPEQLTTEQLAQLLGVHEQTVYTWLQKGQIPGYKIGRAWLIVRDEVKDHLRKHSNQPPQPETDQDTE